MPKTVHTLLLLEFNFIFLFLQFTGSVLTLGVPPHAETSGQTDCGAVQLSVSLSSEHRCLPAA